MITLAHLSRMAERLPVVAALARAMGAQPETLRRRIERGSPDLSRSEAEAVRDYLDGAGLTVQTGEADQ